MPYIPSSTYESRGRSSYQPESPFIDARSRHPAPRSTIDPEVTNVVAPSQGTAGSTLVLHLRTKFDLINDPEPNTFFFMFNAKRCEAALQKMGQVDDYYNYALSVQVPPFPLTNSWDPKMMLKLRMENSDGQTLHEVDAGSFTFVDMSPTLAYQSSPELAKKRKYSTTEFGEPQDYENAAKRANSMRLLAKPRAMSAAYSQASASTLPVQPSLTSTYGYPGGYDMVKQSSYTSQLPQKSLYAIPASMDMKPPQLSPSLPSYTQYSSLAHTGRSPSSIAATPARTSIMSSPATMPTPVLVRATTLPQSATGPAGLPFNPYSIYPSKAKLEIDGDLNTMMEDWTRDELEAKRRLVQFERSQTGSTITTTFMPVTPEARPTRSICVSCIFWEEKNEYFITSVDAIYLLEQLVNVRFTVEEKNRIRRNLEGFRPMTVSKAKADSEEFFKVIMGFPNPKPRNIEKDVKVFHWNILSHALKKIIGKYVRIRSPTSSYATKRSADGELCFDSRRWFSSRVKLRSLCACWHSADSRRWTSQYVTTIGRKLSCFERVHPTYGLDKLVSERISWPGHVGIPKGSD
jgi:hypothetical protein